MATAADNDNTNGPDRERMLAEAVRTACAEAAREAYNDASIRGLCSEGAAEVAVGTIRALDLTPFVDKAGPEKEDTVTDRNHNSG